MKAYACLNKQRLQNGDYAILPVQPEHIEPIRLWRNAQMNILRQSEPILERQQISYYANNIWPSMKEPMPANILMSYLFRDELIGYGGLVHIAWHDLCAEISFLLSPDRAINSAIYSADFQCFLGLIKHLAFDYLCFQRLYTETYEIRSLHIKILENSGFMREGVLRQHVRIGGNPINSIIHGCLKKCEWKTHEW